MTVSPDQSQPAPPGAVTVDADALTRLAADIFEALGVAEEPARYVAASLVDADLEGIASHGVMLLPMYVARLRAGSVSTAPAGRVVLDRDAVGVIDAENALGQLTARQAVALAAAKAKRYGLGAVAVRNGFHFGAAGRFALDLAAAGCVGIVMCNTRPLLPAPGGAEALVGNNPIAIAVPVAGEGPPALLDMATSASAMGKIRRAAAAGNPIPPDWATDADGSPTTDPAAAIGGMLLPAAGPKGFGLAFMIDVICGALSAGAMGDEVRPLYGDPSMSYRCAHFFLALDAAHFRDLDELGSEVRAAVERVRVSPRAAGVERVMSPGEPAWRARRTNAGRCRLDAATWRDLHALAAELGVEPASSATETIQE